MDDLVSKAIGGDRRSIAIAISALESDSEVAHSIRKAMANKRGNAHVIGVTGPPGGGKSTLVAAMITAIRAKGDRVAVIAVDPSSPISGGAVLGDRIRMGSSQADDGVFIRSLASRGHLGGLSLAVGDVIDLFDCAGFETVIVETVGSGQSEVEIAQYADTKVVVCPPGLGDDVQALKAGVLEIGDLYVVTKSDLPGAQKTESDLNMMLSLRKQREKTSKVLRVSAQEGTDLQPLMTALGERTERGLRFAKDASEAYSLVSRCVAADNVAALLGIELVSASLGSATLRMKVERRHVNFNNRCHGGILFALGDMALGLACNSYGKLATLIDGQISIATAVEEGEWVIAEAREVSRSRRIGSYQVHISRARDKCHIALLHGTVYVLDRDVVVEHRS